MKDGTQISAEVSRTTKELLERYSRATGVKKGHLVEQALLHHIHALEALPSDAQIRLNYGVALEMRGRIPEAIRELERSLALRPGDRATEERLLRLRATMRSGRAN